MTHLCPGGCRRRVPHHRYACRDCWFRLPGGIRSRITATYRVNPDAHYEAMTVAAAWYADNPQAAP